MEEVGLGEMLLTVARPSQVLDLAIKVLAFSASSSFPFNVVAFVFVTSCVGVVDFL